jgi:hypothetical protein
MRYPDQRLAVVSKRRAGDTSTYRRLVKVVAYAETERLARVLNAFTLGAFAKDRVFQLLNGPVDAARLHAPVMTSIQRCCPSRALINTVHAGSASQSTDLVVMVPAWSILPRMLLHF